MSNVVRMVTPRKDASWNRLRWDWQRAILRDSSLSDRAKVLACALVSQFSDHETGDCRPAQAALAAALGTTERTVRRAVEDLEAAGYLVRGAGGHKGTPTSLLFRFRGEVIGVDTIRKADSSDRKTASKADSSDRLSEHQRRTVLTAKADSSDHPPRPPYKDIQISPKGARVKRARPDLSALIAADGEESDAWNRWLRSRGYPALAQLGGAIRKEGGAFFDVPFRIPPIAAVPISIAENWVAWAQTEGDHNDRS